ncbi:hypothetical protein D3C72_2062560 [compost metagenome]
MRLRTYEMTTSTMAKVKKIHEPYRAHANCALAIGMKSFRNPKDSASPAPEYVRTDLSRFSAFEI